uniref:Putative ixodes 8-cys protein n=1 Tax=Ixodes ricinus TaxID=34613 RepID=A0A0K8R3G0_IXORI
MKVVCIIVLFVIAAAIESVASNAKSPDAPKADADTRSISISSKDQSDGKTTRPFKLKFPPFIKDGKALALQPLHMCEGNNKQNQQSTKRPVVINEKQVNFKNCTFICQRESGNETLNLPSNTPCGPGNQTCAKPEECVGDVPGC